MSMEYHDTHNVNFTTESNHSYEIEDDDDEEQKQCQKNKHVDDFDDLLIESSQHERSSNNYYNIVNKSKNISKLLINESDNHNKCKDKNGICVNSKVVDISCLSCGNVKEGNNNSLEESKFNCECSCILADGGNGKSELNKGMIMNVSGNKSGKEHSNDVNDNNKKALTFKDTDLGDITINNIINSYENGHIFIEFTDIY
jgi:hypothetical protein